MTDLVTDVQRRDIESLYAAFNRRDVEAVLERLAPDVQWANGMEGGHVIGRYAVRDYWRRQFELVQSQVEPQRIEAGEKGRVAVDVHQVVRSVEGELLDEQRVIHQFTFRGGQISRFDIGS